MNFTTWNIFLPLILAQDYPDFEVVVVNDCSDDESGGEFLDQLARENKKLKVVHLRQSLNFFSGQEVSIEHGGDQVG